MDSLILVDGHVHFRRGFEADSLLESAHANFQSAAQQVASDAALVGVLLLTEGEQEDGFRRLVAQVKEQSGKGRRASSKWRIQDPKECTSVYFTARGCAPIVVVAGRQIPTGEQLEVLAIGTRQRFEEGRSLEALIQEIGRANAIPVVPWGVGKWLGKRGQAVKNLLHDHSQFPPFFLGDNANRPSFWPLPNHFDRAEDRGIKNLPGSDPLPFPDEVRRVGSFGFALRDSLNLEAPTQDLKRKLLDPSIPLHQFGSRTTALRFVRNQLKMQLRKLTR